MNLKSLIALHRISSYQTYFSEKWTKCTLKICAPSTRCRNSIMGPRPGFQALSLALLTDTIYFGTALIEPLYIHVDLRFWPVTNFHPLLMIAACFLGSKVRKGCGWKENMTRSAYDKEANICDGSMFTRISSRNDLTPWSLIYRKKNAIKLCFHI